MQIEVFMFVASIPISWMLFMIKAGDVTKVVPYKF